MINPKIKYYILLFCTVLGSEYNSTRKMVPITEQACLFFFDFLLLKTPISIQIKSKSNRNHIQSFFFCSSFFLCLQGQHELCGSYHLFQSCFSIFVHLHGQPEPFGSYHLLQSCFSLFVGLHGQPEPFGSYHLLLLVFSKTHFHHLASIF